MANNYTYTSMCIAGVTTKEKRWFEKALKGLETNAEADGDFYWGITAVFKPISKTKSNLYLHDEDGCPNLDALADLLQLFLLEFHPDHALSFSWADTCSKPRPDEFGGGAAVISASEVRFLHTSEWRYREIDKLEESLAKDKAKTKNEKQKENQSST